MVATDEWIFWLCLLLAVWTALEGGVFKAFSEFIMRALACPAPIVGVSAMQEINRTVLGTEFVFAIIALGAVTPLFALAALMSLQGFGTTLIGLAALAYVVFVPGMTIFGNVPMNNRLDRLDPASDEAAAYWPLYLRRWTRMNHARTAGCIVAAALYALAAATLAASGTV
jgi:uncharacterized membrane protein